MNVMNNIQKLNLNILIVKIIVIMLILKTNMIV